MAANTPKILEDSGGRHVVILANPKAGSRSRLQAVDELIENLASRGLQPALCWERESFSEQLKKTDGLIRCVVAAGGDGTLQEVINRAPGLPISILPLGNENLLARHFHVARSGKELVETIMHGHSKKLDLGRVNGRIFSLMAGIGFDAEVVHRIHQSRLGHINKLSYVWPILKTLHDYAFPAMEAEIMDTGERLQGAMAFVFNFPEYGLRLPIAPEATPDDGLLNLCVFEQPGIGALLRYLDAVVRGRQGQRSDIQCRLVKRVRFWSQYPVPLQLDGDPAGWLPAAVEVLPAALSLVVPTGRVGA
ncbi:MAG: diacylglycerol/lipid kinase family protein [Gemmataceae bacterium]